MTRMIEPKYQITPSIFSVMSKMASDYKAINLSQGFPDFKVHPDLIGFVEKAMKEEWNQYVPMPGIPKLRDAVSKLISNTYNVPADPDKNITITAGATQGIYDVITAVVKPGQKVIIMDPSYDCYAPAVMANGGIPVHINLTYPDYDLDFNKLDDMIDDQTVLLVLNNPHNPTGHVFSDTFLDQVSEIVLKYPQLYLLSDEVYEHIHFSSFKSVCEMNELYEKSFVISSFGKTFHATGWKVGYINAPDHLTNLVRGIHQYMVFSVNSAMQKGLADFIESQDFKADIASMYQEKRDVFLKGLEGSRFKPVQSNGSYFQTLDFRAIDDQVSDVEMAKKLTQEYGVASIPTSVFFNDKTDRKLLRFCFAKDSETLNKATEILCQI